MQMIIYSPTGTEILDAPVTKEAIIKYVLMGDYYIELPFNLLEPTTFARGSHITYKGRKFEIMSTVRPEFDNKTGGYKYTLKFEAQQNHMKRFVCFWLGGDNPEAVFHNTTDLASFAALIVANMNKQLGGENWQVGTITVDNPKATKLVSFNGDKCWDILNTIAETFETEWWTEENGNLVSLCFGKLDFGSPEEFKQGNVVKNIPAKKGDDSSYGTRFYVFGSTRNLTSDYGQAPQGGETNHVSEIRLRLPDGQRYIDAIPGISGSDIVEQVVFFDDIYPKNTETVTSIETVDREIIEGQTDKAYVMYCKDTPFLPSDMIEGETLGATFTSGSLMGRDFELSINYKPETWKPEDGFDKKFEIIAQVETSGESQLIIPNESLHPEPGDTFVITGVKLPKERIDEAEKELLKAGESYAAKHSSDTDVYDCETNPVYCQENKKNYDAGQAVRLVDPRFGESGRLSRIQGYEKKLYNEYIATYTVGDNTAYSRIGNIESEVKANLYAQRIGVTESGASIYLITRYDSTAAADYNAYSARRALWEFANKQFPDTFKGRMTFDDGAQFGNFASGMTGLGGMIDKKGNAELQSLKLRGFLEVPELRYNRVEISMGDTWYAPSAGIIESVDTEAQTITLKLEEGEIGSPRVGDICMGIFHNLNTSENATTDYDDGRGNRRFAGFATCYFRITEELDTTTHKTFKYQLRPVSGAYPTQYHPAASMTFVGYGSFSNEDRQTSRYETRTYQRYLTGVSDWEFTASNIAAQYGDLSNLSVFGINMTGYSAYLNNIYMSGVVHQFTPGGEEVPTIIDRGVWSATETYNRNDDVYWNNGHWRCLVDGTKTEPGKDAEEWVYLGGYGVLETDSIFKKSENEPAKPTELKIPPEGWTTETLPMSDQRPTWMCTGTVVDGEVKSWSEPQRISGEPGLDGKDGKDYEWIFARTSQYKAPAQPPTSQQDDYVPAPSVTTDGQVWTDNAVGPDSDNPYEWASKRVKGNDGMWGKFTSPALWAKFSFDGAPGVDGTDVEWIFKRTSSNTAPNTPSGSDEDGYVPSGWTNNPTGPNSERPYEWTCVRYKTGGHWSGYSAASLWAKWSFNGVDGVDGEGVEYIFTRTKTEDSSTVPEVPAAAEYDNPPAPWTDDPTGVDATYRYEWVSKRNKVEGVWGAFSAPSIWARYSYDGAPGNWTSYVFKKSDTEPAKPTSSDPIPSGWSDAPTGVGIWWMSKATIDASTGKAGAWSTPIRVTGEDGEPGPHTDFKYAKNNSTTTAPALVKTDRNPAGWSDTPPSLSSGEYLWMTQAEIDANNNLLHPTVGWATPVRISGEQGPKGDDGAPGEDGNDGKDGLQGCIIRLTEWASGVEYRNDLDLVSNGPRYIDIVTIYANNKQLKFQCSQTHTSSASNKPAAGATSAYWQQLNDMVPIYTPLLFAENAVINFLQGMEFVVHNSKTDISESTIIAGLVGGDIPLFVGSNTPSNAPFRVAKDGSFVATKADITGTINASSGIIGGFEIGESWLVSQTSTGKEIWSNKLSAARVLLECKGGAYTNSFDAMAYPLGSSGYSDHSVLSVAINRESYDATNRYNIGIDVSAEGEYNENSQTGNIPNGNHAILLRKGDICGFRLFSRTLTSAWTLTDYESIIFNDTSGVNYITLPSSPKPGQIYFIRKIGKGNVTIQTGGLTHVIKQNAGSTTRSVVLDYGSLAILMWNENGQYWTANDCPTM
jgi:hypothetical protein|nr:MAG TPA: tail protein [Caudoviricetes sp.]